MLHSQELQRFEEGILKVLRLESENYKAKLKKNRSSTNTHEFEVFNALLKSRGEKLFNTFMEDMKLELRIDQNMLLLREVDLSGSELDKQQRKSFEKAKILREKIKEFYKTIDDSAKSINHQILTNKKLNLKKRVRDFIVALASIMIAAGAFMVMYASAPLIYVPLIAAGVVCCWAVDNILDYFIDTSKEQGIEVKKLAEDMRNKAEELSKLVRASIQIKDPTVKAMVQEASKNGKRKKEDAEVMPEPKRAKIDVASKLPIGVQPTLVPPLALPAKPGVVALSPISVELAQKQQKAFEKAKPEAVDKAAIRAKFAADQAQKQKDTKKNIVEIEQGLRKIEKAAKKEALKAKFDQEQQESQKQNRRVIKQEDRELRKMEEAALNLADQKRREDEEASAKREKAKAMLKEQLAKEQDEAQKRKRSELKDVGNELREMEARARKKAAQKAALKEQFAKEQSEFQKRKMAEVTADVEKLKTIEKRVHAEVKEANKIKEEERHREEEKRKRLEEQQRLFEEAAKLKEAIEQYNMVVDKVKMWEQGLKGVSDKLGKLQQELQVGKVLDEDEVMHEDEVGGAFIRVKTLLNKIRIFKTHINPKQNGAVLEQIQVDDLSDEMKKKLLHDFDIVEITDSVANFEREYEVRIREARQAEKIALLSAEQERGKKEEVQLDAYKIIEEYVRVAKVIKHLEDSNKEYPDLMDRYSATMRRLKAEADTTDLTILEEYLKTKDLALLSDELIERLSEFIENKDDIEERIRKVTRGVNIEKYLKVVELFQYLKDQLTLMGNSVTDEVALEINENLDKVKQAQSYLNPDDLELADELMADEAEKSAEVLAALERVDAFVEAEEDAMNFAKHLARETDRFQKIKDAQAKQQKGIGEFSDKVAAKVKTEIRPSV